MRQVVARCVVAVGAGLALMVAQGCKKQAAPAPVQRVVASVPRVRPDFALGPLPVEDIDAGVMPRVDRTAPRPPEVQPVQAPVQQADTQAPAAEVQRRQDAMLLEQQQMASQRQQEELDQEIEQNVRAQQEMEAEPRIQDVPELPLSAPVESTQPE
ncbi:MAG TPA: hypothetical protein VHS13_05535 [Edaphobacter sp.]|nr:hypothetical protein [Edaphobacter sp.]